MSILTEKLPMTDRLGNEIQVDFRNMLRADAVVWDNNVPQAAKAPTMVALLYGGVPKDIQQAFNEFLWFYNGGKDVKEVIKENRKAKGQPIAYDFEIDSGRILAGFMSAYNIDLTDVNSHKKMHWWKFLELFRNLPEDTMMSQYMAARTVETNGMSKDQKKFYEAKKRRLAIVRNVTTGMTLEEINRQNIEWAQAKMEEARREVAESKKEDK